MSSKSKTSAGKRDPYASRWLRLAGAMIDGIILCPLAIAFYRLPDWDAMAADWSVNVAVLRQASAVVLGITLFLLIHGWLIYTRGQTVGKLICGTVVVTKDGQQVSGNRYIFCRLVPFWAIGQIPYLGSLVAIADTLAIFRREKNRLADDIAGTRVIMKADLKMSLTGKNVCSLVSFNRANFSLKEQLEYFRDGLQSDDPQTCGNSPKWIREVLVEKLELVLAKSSEPTFDDEAKCFVENAKRYVAENSGQESKLLSRSLSQLMF